MIKYGKHHIDNSDIKNVIKALKSDYLTQGKQIKKFEKDICEFTGAKYSVVLSSGTSALFLIGKLLGWSKKDYILTTPITFVASANAVLYSMANIEFVDIDTDTYNISVDHLERKIRSLKKIKKKVSAVIATDFAGNPCDWSRLKTIAKKYKFKLINDNCHALGAKYNNNQKYSLKYADFSTLSFHPVKVITTGEGGALLTNNKKFRDKAEHYASHCKFNLKNSSKPWSYDILDLGYNFRITDFQCALGISQLKKIKIFLNYRKKVALIYDNLFKNNEVVKIPKKTKNSEHAYHLYPLVIDFNKISKNKKFLFKFLKNRGYDLMVHYPPIHLFTLYKKKFNFKRGDYPNAEKFYQNEISLPIFFKLEIKEVKRLAGLIVNFLDRYKKIN